MRSEYSCSCRVSDTGTLYILKDPLTRTVFSIYFFVNSKVLVFVLEKKEEKEISNNKNLTFFFTKTEKGIQVTNRSSRVKKDLRPPGDFYRNNSSQLHLTIHKTIK